jgi:hypothetical protein
MTGALASKIVYDNTANNLDKSIEAASGETGSQITLVDTERVVTEFLFGYRHYGPAPDVTAHIRFYANDGHKGAPGTLLFESDPVKLDHYGDHDKTLSGLAVTVPATFTWTIRYSEEATQYAMPLVYGPPTVGSNGPGWLLVGSGPPPNWSPDHSFSLKARVTAQESFPRGGWPEEKAAQILAGVINDGGGLILLGGHIIRVPPRGPLEAILAALPAELVQRLRPLLAAGDQPEATLRQQLSHVITQYQKELPG